MTHVASPPVPGLLLHALAKHWWVLLLRGICAILFGVLTFVWPGIKLLTLLLLYGPYALADAALAITTAKYGAQVSACAEIAPTAPGAWSWGKTRASAMWSMRRRRQRGAYGYGAVFIPCRGLFISQFVTLRRPMYFQRPKAAARKQSRVWRVRWLKFSMKSCCIPAWPRSSRGLSCSRRRPGSAKAVIKFRVWARRRPWLAPAARTCRIDPYGLRFGASKCPDEVATAV